MAQTRHDRYLNLLPPDWPIKPISDMGPVVGGSTPSREIASYWGGSIPWATPTDMTALQDRTILYTKESITEAGLNNSGARLLPTGSVVVTTRASIGMVGVAGCPLTTNQGFKSIIPNRDVDPNFLYHLLGQLSHELYRRASGTTFQEISGSEFGEIQVPSPLVDEQARIAEVLDTLDEAIRTTASIIAKRILARQGLIRDLLTCGVDQNGERRDPNSHLGKFVSSSLGMIPRSWTIKALSSSCLAVMDCPHSTPNFLDQGVLVARTMHIKNGRFDTRFASRVSEGEYQTRVSRIEPAPGDVVFTREAPVGEAFVIPEGMRICLGQRVMLLRPDPETLLGDYLVSQIYSGAVQSRIKLLTGGTTNPHLNVAEVRAFHIPIPPIQEQRILVSYLRGFEQSIEAEKEQLRKLETLKSGFSSDLLTGRIRTKNEPG